MALSQKQVKDVCFIHGGSKQCRYLDEAKDDKGNIVDICRKLSPDRAGIDEEVNDEIAQKKKKGEDPMKDGHPMGDNCQGYVILLTKIQGYDV